MNPGLILSLVLILLVLIVVFAYMTTGGRRRIELDKDKYRSDWLAIENRFSKDEVAHFEMVVLNADKLLDRAMEELGFAGKTMGERLKNSQNRFSNLNGVWRAHKLRNQIAHEVNVKLTFEQVRAALSQFKQALKDLGAI